MLVVPPPFDLSTAEPLGLLLYRRCWLVGRLLMVSTGTHAQQNGWNNRIASLQDAGHKLVDQFVFAFIACAGMEFLNYIFSLSFWA
jgi:hypothetical protein